MHPSTSLPSPLSHLSSKVAPRDESCPELPLCRFYGASSCPLRWAPECDHMPCGVAFRPESKPVQMGGCAGHAGRGLQFWLQELSRGSSRPGGEGAFGKKEAEEHNAGHRAQPSRFHPQPSAAVASGEVLSEAWQIQRTLSSSYLPGNICSIWRYWPVSSWKSILLLFSWPIE